MDRCADPTEGNTLVSGDRGLLMHVWIDQDCCTGAGLCVDRCPELFVVLEDGLGYVYDDAGVIGEPGRPRPVPARYALAAIDAAEQCPGECIYLEAGSVSTSPEDDVIEGEIVEGEIVGDPS